MKFLPTFLLILMAGALTIASQQTTKQTSSPGSNLIAGSPAADSAKLPAHITLILEVTELAGSETPKSFWEGTYEIRVADWSEIVEKTKSGTTNDAGEVLVRSSFSRRALNDKDQRRVAISLPVEGALRDRLQHETTRAQAFLLRAKIRAYDGKLDQNYVFDLNRIWQSALFPEGEAKITISLKADGGYNSWGPAPRQLPPGYTIIGRPAASAPRP